VLTWTFDLGRFAEPAGRSLSVVPGAVRRPQAGGRLVETLLWILAVVLVVAGIVALVRRQLLWGIVLIVVGLLVGPGGVSVFS
jgi:hypothetical protein